MRISTIYGIKLFPKSETFSNYGIKIKILVNKKEMDEQAEAEALRHQEELIPTIKEEEDPINYPMPGEISTNTSHQMPSDPPELIEEDGTRII